MPATALRCRICETQFALDPVGVCNRCFGPLEPVYDRDEQRRTVSRESIEAGPPNMSVDTWRPDGPDRTIGVTDYFYAEHVPDETVAEMIAFSTQVGDEDNALVESVQRGLASGMVPQGRLLPASEQLIQHFQRLVFDSLAR